MKIFYGKAAKLIISTLLLAFMIPAMPMAVHAAAHPDWARVEVQRAHDMDIVPTGGGYDSPTTRAEFAAFAVRLYERQRGAIIGVGSFTDTDDPYVLRAAHAGLVRGRGDGVFDPHGHINRQEAAALLYNVARRLGDTDPGKHPPFNDIGNLPDFAIAGVHWAFATEVVGGVGDNRFYPLGVYTRRQTIVSMVRVYDVVNVNNEDVVVLPPIIETPMVIDLPPAEPPTAYIPTPPVEQPQPPAPPANNQWGEVVVLGEVYSLYGGGEATLSFAQQHGNDWFILSRGHASFLYRDNNLSIDGAHLSVGGVHVATAFANTAIGVVSVATPGGAAHLNLSNRPRVRAAQPQLGYAFLNIGGQRVNVNIIEIDEGETLYEVQGLDFGMSGSPLTQYQNGTLVFGGVLYGGEGPRRGFSPLLEDTMHEFNSQIALFQQR